MVRALVLVLLLALTACTGLPQGHGREPCTINAAGYDCEIQRYMRAQ